jgi:hypothetical protein
LGAEGEITDTSGLPAAVDGGRGAVAVRAEADVVSGYNADFHGSKLPHTGTH